MYQYNPAYLEALEMAIAALKAEPCEDAVSLDGVIDTIEWYRTNPQHFTEDNLIEDIKGLPPVTPKQRTGKWVIGGYNDDFYVCDCGFAYVRVSQKYNYCPNCGAKMEGEIE